MSRVEAETDDPAEQLVMRIWDEIDGLASTAVRDTPRETPDASELDRLTVSGWLEQQTGDPLAIRLFDMAIPSVLAAVSSETSMLHFLFYVASANGLSMLTDTAGGAQESRVAGGTQRISLAELVGAIGLVVPGLLNAAEVLTPLAAAGLATEQVGAAITHRRRNETANIPVNLLLMLATGFTAFGRFFLEPLA